MVFLHHLLIFCLPCEMICSITIKDQHNHWKNWGRCRADSRLAPRQWETLLQSTAVFHWLDTNLESALWCHLTLRPGQKGGFFLDKILMEKVSFVDGKYVFFNSILLKFVPRSLIDSKSILFQVRACIGTEQVTSHYLNQYWWRSISQGPMGLMQQATHPMWYYVRGRLR